MLPFEHDLIQKVKKDNIELIRNFDVENISVKLQNNTGNSCRVIVFTRQLDLEQDFYVENIQIKLEQNTGNLRRVIMFTRFRTLIRRPRQQQHPSSLRRMRGKKVTQRSHKT